MEYVVVWTSLGSSKWFVPAHAERAQRVQLNTRSSLHRKADSALELPCETLRTQWGCGMWASLCHASSWTWKADGASSLYFQHWHCASPSRQRHRHKSRRLPKKKPERMLTTAPTRKGRKGLLFIPLLRLVFWCLLIRSQRAPENQQKVDA